MGVGFCFSLAFAPGVRGWALECSDRVPRAALRLSSGGFRRLPRVRQWPVGSQGRGGSGREVPSSSGVAGSIRVAPTAEGSAVVGVPPRRCSEGCRVSASCPGGVGGRLSDLFKACKDQLRDRFGTGAAVGRRHSGLARVRGQRHSTRILGEDDLLEAAMGVLPESDDP